MDFNQLLEQRKVKVVELEAMQTKCKTENREMFTSENEAFNAIENEIKNIDKQLEEKRKITVKNNITIKNTNTKMENRFNLLSYFNHLAEGRNFTEAEQQVMNAGAEGFKNAGLTYRGYTLPFEFRTGELVAGTAGLGAETVAEEKYDLLMPLRAKLVFAQAGATFLNNLTGNISIPVFTGTTSGWKGETIEADPAGGGFKEIELAPKRLTTILSVSKQFLIQNSVGAEQKLMNDLVNSIKNKLEATALGTASGNTTMPAGIFYGSDYTCDGVVISGDCSFSKIVSMESAINSSNAEGATMHYIVHPSTVGKLKTTAKAANTAVFVAEGGLLNGYKYITTTNMPTISNGKGVLFGAFDSLYIGQWGNMDITVDNLSSAKFGLINFIINSYWDVKAVRAEAFATGWLK